MPGTCAYCAGCSRCQEGPEGTPGGCGYCRFCSPDACPESQCVGGFGAAAVGGNCQATNGNVEGLQILVLDVNSWEESSGPQSPPKVTTAAQCCDVSYKFTPHFLIYCTSKIFQFSHAGMQTHCRLQWLVFLF